MTVTIRSGQRLWMALALALAAGSLLAWLAPSAALDWQPARAWNEPWRCLSAAFVHWSGWHLGANLAAAAVVAAYGWVAELPPRAGAAWLAAWPLTHLALLLQPELAHYGGLSGVLHAGVAVGSLWLLWRGRGRRRVLGGTVLLGLLLKLLDEAAWQTALRPGAWDIVVAPLAHAAGAAAGLLCAALALALMPATPEPVTR